MQSPVGGGDDMEAKQRKERTIQSVYAHGSMMLSLGHTYVPGLRNVDEIYRIKKLKKDGTSVILKKSMAGILQYLKWEEEKVFQSVWTMEDGTAMVFFSNVIRDIQSYVMNWTMCPAANIYWFLVKKGCNEEDVRNMLEGCFSPEELIKIKNVAFHGEMAVLKEKITLGMTAVIQHSRQFDMDRGLTDKEKLSKVQKAAEDRIHYGEATHGAIGAFNFEGDNEDVKTISKKKKAGPRAAESVSGKTFADDIYSVAGNTTLPSYKEAEEDDSFTSSISSLCDEGGMDAEVDKKDQEFVDLTDQSKERIVDMTSMEEDSEQKGANEETEDNMSLGFGSGKDDNQATNSNKSDEADRAGTGYSGSGSFDKDCNDEQDRRYDNKVKTPVTFLQKLWNEKGSSTVALKEACSDLKEQMILAGKEEEEQLQLTGYSDDLIQSLKEEKEV
jgi:hypothetical protein